MPIDAEARHAGGYPPPAWDANDLERRVVRALDIARATLQSFAAEGHVDVDVPALSFGPEKPVAETAMLLHAAAASRHRLAIGRRVDALAETLVPLARSDRVRMNMALNPSLALKFAVPHVLLSRLGHPDSAMDRLLAACSAASCADGHERAPSAQLERLWISLAQSGRAVTGEWRAHARHSLLARPLDILAGTREDAYAFTHLLFYATDFGAAPVRMPEARSTVLRRSDSLLARYLDAEDYDLSAELLMAWPFTAAPWGPTAAFAFRVLAAVEDGAGLLPCGNMDLRRLARLEGAARARYALATGYHTAYVMGLLCAAALRPGRAPPRAIPGRRHRASLCRELRAMAKDDQGHWQAEFDCLAPDEQRALVPFLLDMTLVQRYRLRDYAGLADLLALARREGIAHSSLCLQAAELLLRIAACADSIGEGSPVRFRGAANTVDGARFDSSVVAI